MALVLDGLNGITFPNASVQNNAVANTAAVLSLIGGRGLTPAVQSAGAVLQVVSTTYATTFSTTSTTYVATGITASITPLFSTSKIMVIVTADSQGVASQNFNSTIYRGATDLSGTSGGAGFGYIASGTVGTNVIVNINYLDSPATTSSTSYTYQIKTTSGTAYTCVGNSLATMTLMEIAA